ncbi:hypothetical protein E4U42_002988 [Claviceps africana]|uniref:Uncharacterized protein n=1 Tax=Claviceps africana TaxID=83212 RepID=A0A8K0J7F7_9HYPO|nr:hypothetical protein E4U42_002988 [Claviceps africana]
MTPPTGITDVDVEILVHVAAPSRIADDATYRQLARAYLAFRPTAQEHTPSDNGPFISESQELSFQSALDNRSSPRIAPPSPWEAPPSEIGDSYPLPTGMLRATPTGVLQRYLERDDDAGSSDGIDVPSSIPLPVIPVTPAPPPASGLPRKRPAPEHDADADADTTHISISSASTDPDTAYPTASLSILPPSPPPSVSPLVPSSLISPKLDKLARDLSSRYNPLPHRSLRPLERGHWLVDCRAWSPSARLDAWLFLSNYLSSGLAGWAVWCSRDESRHRITLFCWAHVAKHMYLLLYLASGRELKSTGAQWHDASGEPVIEVPGVGSRDR